MKASALVYVAGLLLALTAITYIVGEYAAQMAPAGGAL